MCIRVLWKYLHKWGHYLKVVFNYCCGRYSRTLLRHPHAFDFAFVYVRFVFFSSRLSRFFYCCFAIMFFTCCSLHFFFFLANNLDKLFLSVRQMGPMASAGCGAHFAHLFGVSVPINDQIFLSRSPLLSLFCLSSLLFYVILFSMQVNGMNIV